MKYIITGFFVFGTLLLSAQIKNPAFLVIDKRVRTIQSSNPQELSKKLTAPYKTELEKVRAIFRWITENISYDVIGYHDTNGIYAAIWDSVSSEEDDVIRAKNYNNGIVKKVLKERRAICDGYARLFKSLCDYSNIQSEVITGHTRFPSERIGETGEADHAWNAVFINNTWQLLDATWASGYVNDAVTVFTKRYEDFYFFPNPIHFFNNHYPSDPKWSLLPYTPTVNEFYSFPFFYPAFYNLKVNFLYPTTGTMEITSYSRVIRIELETKEQVKDVEVSESTYGKRSTTDSLLMDSINREENYDPAKKKYEIQQHRIIYYYKVKSLESDMLQVKLNDQEILRYRIRVRA